jgi:hypothetical protein
MLTETGKSSSRWSTFPTIETNNSFFWFGFVLKGNQVLELTSKKLKAVFEVPDADATRRAKLMAQANHEAVYHVVSLNDKILTKNEFLFLEFIIAPEDLDVSNLPPLVPLQPPIIMGRPTNLIGKFNIRAHPCSLVGLTEKIWVIASKHVGNPAEKAILVVSKHR